MKFQLINQCIDHTGEYWYSEKFTKDGLYQAGYFDHGTYIEIKEFETQVQAIEWLKKIRKDNN